MTKTPRPRGGRPARGYALLFVLIVGVTLSIVIAGMFDLLAEQARTSTSSQEELQQVYGCEGALRLASAEVLRAPDADISQLQQALGRLAGQLRGDKRPGSRTPWADLAGITLLPTQVGEIPTTQYPFGGLMHVAEASEFIVTANPRASQGRTCRARAPNERRTMSLFQFAAVSHQRLSSTITHELQVTAATTGQVATLQHSMITGGGLLSHELAPYRDELDERQERVTRSGGTPFTVRNIHVADFQGFRPLAPAGWVWTQVVLFRQVAPWRGNGGKRNRPSYKPPSMEYYTKSPQLAWVDPRNPDDPPIPDPTLARFALQADIRIIDGEWFVADRRARYPGREIWSDRPTKYREVPEHILYSDYEQVGGAMVSAASVIRYGAATPLHGSNPLSAATRVFADPYENSNNAPTPILPIVFDGARFAAAMTTRDNGELGMYRCLEDDPVLCPETRRFKGAVWIGSTPGGHRPRDGSRPCPLVEETEKDCARPNAVVLKNMGRLEIFAATGLSIGSNLPIYIVGGVNDETALEQRTSRIAIMAPVVTVLSAGADLQNLQDAVERVRIEASVFTGWASDDSTKRDPSRHLLRRLQPGVKVEIVGSMVGMFTRSQYPFLR
jgi:Tfp pilus assembly protein PilX